MSRHRFTSKMKRLEFVVAAERVDGMLDLIQQHATGYTVLPGATGLGEHGLREQGMAVIVTVLTEEHLEQLIAALSPSLNERANIVVISDVEVVRAEHFMPEVRAATRRNAP